MKIVRGVALGVLVAASASLHADFTYTETTQITGGSMLGLMKMAGAFSRQARQAGDPIVSTVAIKGNRMAHINPDRTEIIDLDAETITAAAAKMKEQRQKAETTTPQQGSTTDVKFQIHVRKTGQARDVSGLSTSESILTMNMDATDKSSGQTGSLAITNDMWMVPEVPGYDEVKEFYRKF